MTNRMASELYKFLKTKQVDVPPYTHTSYIGGKYNIKEVDYDKLNRLYYKALVDYYKPDETFDDMSNHEKPMLFLIERLQDVFNFCQDVDNKDSELGDSDIIELINETKEQLIEYTAELIECTVLKRNDNYHLHYNCKTTKEQAQKITEILKERLTDNISSKLDVSPYKNGGMRMLGSYNKDKTDYYKLYDIKKRQYTTLTYGRFKQTLLESKSEKAISQTSKNKQKGKEEMLSRQNKEIAQEITQLLKDLKTDDILKERIKNIDKIDKFNLDVSKVKHIKNKYTGLSDFYITIKERFCPFKGREHSRDSDYLYLDLSHKGLVVRCYDTECVRQHYPTDPIKLPLDWPEFVKKYNTLTKLLTVKYYTAEVEMTSEIRELVEKSISGTNYSMAKLIFTLYKDLFRVDEMRNTEWYYFNGVRWEKTQKLGILISEEIPKYYKSIKFEAEGDDESGKDLLKYNELVDKCVYKLESTSFKKSLIEELKIMFFELDKKFADKLDANVYLLGFENGVYDLQNQMFRLGKPDDYITFSTGYDYLDYDENNEITKEIYSFLKKLLPKDAVREYTLKVLGRGLLGIPDEKFYMWTGLSGSNGKSTLTKLLEKVYGQYAISCDTALLTNKRAGSSSASPELVEMRGKRAVFFQEPENTDTLKTGLLKQLSGGDTVKARELFKSLVSFVCQAMFVMCCNELPKINSKGDGGTWRRLRVTEFLARFVDNPNPDKQYEFAIDYDLKQKMTYWLPYVMSILIHYYKKQKTEGIKEPKEVTVATNRYKGDNNEFEEYFESNVEKDTKGVGASFSSIRDIYDDFIDWWTDNYGQEKAPSILELKKVMRSQYGDQITEQVNGSSVKGFKVRLKTCSNPYIEDV